MGRHSTLSPEDVLKAFGLAAAATIAAALSTSAQEIEVTPFIAHRWGGTLSTEEGTLGLAASPAWGAVLNVVANDGALIEVSYVQQNTELQLSGSPSGSGPLFDIVVRYVQAGAVYRGRWPQVEPHLAFTVGFANFDPKAVGRDQAWGWTGSAGAGVTVPPQSRVALRLEGRGWLTSLHGPDALFCRSGSGCVVSVSGPLIWQGQLSAGLALAF